MCRLDAGNRMQVVALALATVSKMVDRGCKARLLTSTRWCAVDGVVIAIHRKVVPGHRTGR